MKDSDIDSLSADGAQDTERMTEGLYGPVKPLMQGDTDPRAALAEVIHEVIYDSQRASKPDADEDAARIAAPLAERGVLLVTRERLAGALEVSGLSYERPLEQDTDRVWSALAES